MKILRSICAIAALTFFGMLHGSVGAAPPNAAPPAKAPATAKGDAGVVKQRHDFSDVACMEKALRLTGRTIDTMALLMSPHWPASGEPSPEVLEAMARDQKVHTVRYSDLSLRQLERLNLPVILHLKGSRYSSAPDHYVVCTSVQNGQANLFNPPERVSQVPLDLLATRWDGHALILSADPINVPAVPLTERPVVQYSAVILLAALLIFGGYKYVRQHPAAPAGAWSQTAIAGVAQCLLITACAAALGFAARFALGMSILPTAATSLMPDGPDPMDFLVNVDSSGVIAERARDIDLATMHQAVQRGALLVDARDAGEYAAGHIKGAISCPANDVAHLRLYLAGIPLNRQIVVYCGSAQCGKGHYVASALLQNGFTNVAVWPPGWAQWSGPKETGAR